MPEFVLKKTDEPPSASAAHPANAKGEERESFWKPLDKDRWKKFIRHMEATYKISKEQSKAWAVEAKEGDLLDTSKLN